MDYYSAILHPPKCEKCDHKMTYSVGSSIRGKQWIMWSCPHCRTMRRIDYKWPKCPTCETDCVAVYSNKSVLPNCGKVIAFHCNKCGFEYSVS